MRNTGACELNISIPGSVVSTNTYEQIKSELLYRKPDLPNPAVYAIETSLKFPLDETLLPVAKRSLVRYISIKGRLITIIRHNC